MVKFSGELSNQAIEIPWLIGYARCRSWKRHRLKGSDRGEQCVIQPCWLIVGDSTIPTNIYIHIIYIYTVWKGILLYTNHFLGNSTIPTCISVYHRGLILGIITLLNKYQGTRQSFEHCSVQHFFLNLCKKNRLQYVCHNPNRQLNRCHVHSACQVKVKDTPEARRKLYHWTILIHTWLGPSGG